MNQKISEKPIKLFWTSGWDSTSRLLFLVLIAKKQVQPIYIIENKNRKSVDLEIKTMDIIRQKIQVRNAEAAALILPTIYTKLNDIPIDPQISDAYERIARKQYLGGQYVYLASYAKANNHDKIEMSLINQGRISSFLSFLMKEVQADGLSNYQLDAVRCDKDILTIYSYFNFPLISFTKKELGEQARKYGFIDLLELSWSCHSPIAEGVPCGVCPPCCYAIEEGFGYRFPEASLKRYRRSIKRRIYSTLRKYPYLFYIARHTKGLITRKKNVVN